MLESDLSGTFQHEFVFANGKRIARYDSSNLGRFMTPDWDARPTTVPYAVFGDPQSLNLYCYVRNKPALATTYGLSNAIRG